MEEGRNQERAHVARIVDLHQSGAELDIKLALLQVAPPLVNEFVWRMRTALDIDQFEFNRNHWAVKDADLLEALRGEGHHVAEAGASEFVGTPLPGPSRPLLLETATRLATWTNTEIDTFLLKIGIDDLRAGREVGSKRDRVNAILRHVLAFPGTKTAENRLLSALLIEKASPPDTSPSLAAAPFPNTPQTNERVLLPEKNKEAGRYPNRVFVVHGHDETVKATVVEFLSSVGLEGIVLHTRANMGDHLLTKFIREARSTSFALVLMTGDDFGASNVPSPEWRPRARQNVILELGYFLAHLGQPRVCALISPGLETPSDFDGIAYIAMENEQAWKSELLRELRAANLPVRT